MKSLIPVCFYCRTVIRIQKLFFDQKYNLMVKYLCNCISYPSHTVYLSKYYNQLFFVNNFRNSACHKHKKYTSSIFCTTCNNFFCDICSKWHKTHLCINNDFNGLGQNCDVHSSQTKQFFCLDCKLLICHVCKNDIYHFNHKIEELSKLLVFFKKNFEPDIITTRIEKIYIEKDKVIQSQKGKQELSLLYNIFYECLEITCLANLNFLLDLFFLNALQKVHYQKFIIKKPFMITNYNINGKFGYSADLRFHFMKSNQIILCHGVKPNLSYCFLFNSSFEMLDSFSFYGYASLILDYNPFTFLLVGTERLMLIDTSSNQLVIKEHFESLIKDYNHGDTSKTSMTIINNNLLFNNNNMLYSLDLNTKEKTLLYETKGEQIGRKINYYFDFTFIKSNFLTINYISRIELYSFEDFSLIEILRNPLKVEIYEASNFDTVYLMKNNKYIVSGMVVKHDYYLFCWNRNDYSFVFYKYFPEFIYSIKLNDSFVIGNTKKELFLFDFDSLQFSLRICIWNDIRQIAPIIKTEKKEDILVSGDYKLSLLL